MTTVLPPDPLSPTLSASSAMVTPYPQSSGTVALLIEVEETPEENRMGPWGLRTRS